MFKKNGWIAVLLLVAMAMVFIGCEDRPKPYIPPPTFEGNALKISTGSIDWGGGFDLHNKNFNFAAGDVIIVEGYVDGVLGAKMMINIRIAGIRDVLSGSNDEPATTFSPGSSFKAEYTIQASDIEHLTAIPSWGGEPGIRIGARNSGAVYVLTDVILKRGSNILFDLSDYIADMDAGPISASDLFDPSIGFADAGAPTVTFEIISAAAVVPCKNDECRCFDCDSNCPCWDVDDGCECEVATTYEYHLDAVNGEAYEDGVFYLNLNDYKQVGAVNSNVPALTTGVGGGLTANSISLNFTQNNQRVNFKLEDWQAALILGAGNVTVTMEGTATATGTDTTTVRNFRYHFTDAKAGANWNSTNSFDAAAFADIKDEKRLSFSGNKSADTVQFFTIQQTVAAATTLKIDWIKVEIGAPEAITDIDFKLFSPAAGAPAQTEVKGTGFTGTVTWYPELTNGKFSVNTQYFASISFDAQAGYFFASDASVDMDNSDATIGTFNVASRSVMTGMFPATSWDLEPDIAAGAIDGILNLSYEKVRNSTTLFSMATDLVGPLDAQGYADGIIAAGGGNTNMILVAGGINRINRTANWNGVDVIIGTSRDGKTGLNFNPAVDRIKVTAFGYLLGDVGGEVKLAEPDPGYANLPGNDAAMNVGKNGAFMLSAELPRNYLQNQNSFRIQAATDVTGFRVTLIEIEKIGEHSVTPVTISAVPLNAPIVGLTPETAAIETFQFESGAVSWAPSGAAAGDTEYVATMTLTAKHKYTLEGIAANFFTVVGSKSVVFAPATGLLTVTFEKALVLEPIELTNFATQVGGYGATYADGKWTFPNNYQRAGFAIGETITGAAYPNVTIEYTSSGAMGRVGFFLDGTQVGGWTDLPVDEDAEFTINTPAGAFNRITFESKDAGAVELELTLITFNPVE